MNIKNKQANSAEVHHVFCSVYKPYYKRLLLYSELWMSSSCIIARLFFSGKKWSPVCTVSVISFLISNYHPDRPSIMSDSDNVMWSIFARASGIFLPGAMSSLVWTVNSVFDISVAWDDKEDHILLARCNTASCSDEAEIQHSLFNADGHISSLLLRLFPERHNRLLWFLISQGTQLIQASQAFIVCYAMKRKHFFQ